MKASDLNLVELLSLDPERGSIRLENRRMLLWDADAFGTLRRELISTLGEPAARQILRRFGFANGYRDAITMGELFTWDNDEQRWLSCPALQNQEGKVNAVPQRQAVDRANGTFEVEVLWNYSYEADQHVRVFGRADVPVCWSIAGYASGFATALMGEECYVVEEECVAVDGHRCRMVGRTRRGWAEAGARHAADYEAHNLAAELEAREAQLRRQRRALLRRERELARLRGGHDQTRGGIICRSRQMNDALDLAQTVARVDATVLITGESGVGKERVARFVHDDSPRADGPFIAVNCGALPETLLESELFGHTRGAFTGAHADRRGLFEAAGGGTIFLDEIGETSPATQVKLLRVLQEREVRPVGASEPRSIDVRVLAATNRNLEAMVDTGEMRKDLYYRLKVVSIDIPPLRDRRDDILPLARELIERAGRDLDVGPRTLSPEAVDAITAYHWPGNVRELENAIERAVVLAGGRDRIGRGHLPPEVVGDRSRGRLVFGKVVSMEELERQYVLHVLDRFGGNRTHTARALGIGANTLWRKLKSWGVPAAK